MITFVLMKRNPMRLMLVLFATLAMSSLPAVDLMPPVVYLPTDQAASVDPTRQSVLIPYRQFVELWSKTQKPEERPTPPPGPTLASWEGTGTIAETLAEAELSLVVTSAAPGWHEIRLPFPIMSARPPEGVVVQPNGDSVSVHVPGPGRWTIPVRIAAPVIVRDGRPQVALGLPDMPGRLTLTLADREATVIPDQNTAMLVTRTATGSDIKLVTKGRVELAWSRPVAVVRADPLLLAQVDAVATVAEGSLRTTAAIQLDILRQPQESLTIRLPPGSQVLAVTCEAIKTWDRAGDDLILHFHAPVEGRISITISVERLLTGEVVSVAAPQVVGAARQAGHLALIAGEGVGLTPVAGEGWSQVDPRSLGAPTAVAAWRYLGQPSPVAATAAILAAEIRATVAQIVRLDGEQDRMQVWADLDIRRAGVFSLVLESPADWELMDSGGVVVDEQRKLGVSGTVQAVELVLRAKAIGLVRLTAVFQRAATLPREPAAVATTLGVVRVRGARSQRGLLAVAVPASWALGITSRDGLGPADEDRLAQAPWRSGGAVPETVAFSWTDSKPPALVLAVAPKPRELALRQEEIITLDAGALRRQVHWLGEVRHRPLVALRVTAPTTMDGRIVFTGCADSTAVSRSAGLTTWDLRFASPLLGALDITASVSDEIPAVGPVAATLAVPVITPLDATRLTVAVAVAREGALELVAEAPGLDAVAATDLPSGLQRAGVVAGFTGAKPVALLLTATRHDLVALADAGIPLVRHTVVVADDGLVRVRSIAQVVSRGRPHLDVQPASGATLVEVTVDGRLARTSSRSDGRVLVPLGNAGTHVVAMISELRLAGPLSGWHAGKVPLPRLGGPQVPVERQMIALWLPGWARVTTLGEDCRMVGDGQSLWTAVLSRWLPLGRGASLPDMTDDDRHGLTVPIQAQGRLTALVRLGDGGVVGWSAIPGWWLDLVGLLLAAGAVVVGWRWRQRPEALAGLALVSAVLVVAASGPWLRPVIGLGLGTGFAIGLALVASRVRRWRTRQSQRDPLVEG